MKLEENYKTDRGNGSGTTIGYSIEARSTSKPTLILGNMIGEKWTRLEFQRGEKGVPIPGCYDGSGQLAKLGLFSYSSAQAIRWWFHAASENDFINDVEPPLRSLRGILPRPWGVETRLVKHEVKYQYTVTATSVHELVDDHIAPPKETEQKSAKLTLTDEEADLLTFLSTSPSEPNEPNEKKIVEITPSMRNILCKLLESKG
jgi:hypothetical protein